MQWIIIYPGGDRTCLDMIAVYEYEFCNYDLASRRHFSYADEDSCRTYMIGLAEQNGLTVAGKPPFKYLD